MPSATTSELFSAYWQSTLPRINVRSSTKSVRNLWLSIYHDHANQYGSRLTVLCPDELPSSHQRCRSRKAPASSGVYQRRDPGAADGIAIGAPEADASA